MADTPSEEGRKRWPPGGTYGPPPFDKPCICTSDCKDPCNGTCGCDACLNAYNDYLSSPAYYA